MKRSTSSRPRGPKPKARTLQQSDRFPILSLIAKDCLSIMLTSAASERSFSLAGLTITGIKSRLDPNTANQTKSCVPEKLTFARV